MLLPDQSLIQNRIDAINCWIYPPGFSTVAVSCSSFILFFSTGANLMSHWTDHTSRGGKIKKLITKLDANEFWIVLRMRLLLQLWLIQQKSARWEETRQMAGPGTKLPLPSNAPQYLPPPPTPWHRSLDNSSIFPC